MRTVNANVNWNVVTTWLQLTFCLESGGTNKTHTLLYQISKKWQLEKGNNIFAISATYMEHYFNIILWMTKHHLHHNLVATCGYYRYRTWRWRFNDGIIERNPGLCRIITYQHLFGWVAALLVFSSSHFVYLFFHSPLMSFALCLWWM